MSEQTTYTCNTCTKEMNESSFFIGVNRVMHALKTEHVGSILKIIAMNVNRYYDIL